MVEEVAGATTVLVMVLAYLLIVQAMTAAVVLLAESSCSGSARCGPWSASPGAHRYQSGCRWLRTRNPPTASAAG